MKVFVFNLKKESIARFVLRLVAFSVAVFLLSWLWIDSYMHSEGYVAAIQLENEKNTIIIDAGHGGEDPGATGVNGVYEKDLNLSIAEEVGRLLTECGFCVVYTRTTDKLLYTEQENIHGIRKISDLKNRCKIAAEYPNALFVSIHMNSFSSPKYSGLQVYYSKNNDLSRLIADAIQTSVIKEMQPQNNRVVKKGDGIYILEHIDNPAVLIECGFLTNPEECEKLSQKEYQKQLSLAIVYGIINYKEVNSAY